jgi:hypothetical protein
MKNGPKMATVNNPNLTHSKLHENLHLVGGKTQYNLNIIKRSCLKGFTLSTSNCGFITDITNKSYSVYKV